MPEIIKSRKNEIIKTAARLSKSTVFRRERQLCFLEGARLCADAALSGIKIQILFFTEKAGGKYQKYLKPVMAAAGQVYIIMPEVAETLSETKNSQGVFCICETTNGISDLSKMKPEKNYLALEDIQDPANLGASLRTAEALGVGGVILGGECCDAYSPKALRAGMGAIFRLPIFLSEDMVQAVKQMNSAGFVTLAAVPDRAAFPVTQIKFESPAVMVVGNEGNGLSPLTQQICTKRVTIPMPGRAESLNASAAVAILVWEMTQSGGRV